MGDITNSLLARGWFPKEIPPSFVTTDFPTALEAVTPPPSFRTSSRVTRMMTHSLARPGNARRRLGIPNPLTFLLLCESIESNYTDIVSHCTGSPYSRSTPMADTSMRRAYVPSQSLSDLSQSRAETRATGTALLRADLSNFYHSIYTHSIPWALHTKNIAKKQRTNTLYGNDLDRCVRNMQDGQTIGIPVGPDTSLIIAEIIASRVDMEAKTAVPSLRGFRYYDDFEFVFNSMPEAEDALAKLEMILADYELHLHPSKSGTLRLPQSTEPEWIAVLQSFSIRTSSYGQRVDLLNFFDHVFRLITAYPYEHIVSFAIGRLVAMIPDLTDRSLVEALLCQAVTAQPDALPEFFYFLVASWTASNATDTRRLEEVLNRLIAIHAPLNHGSEVAWALWGLIAFGLRINPIAAECLGRMEDSIVALLALDAQQAGLVDTGLDTTRWKALMQCDELFGEQWLLSYEANVRGWLPSVGNADHVSAEPNFGYLKTHQVHFYELITRPVTIDMLARWRPSQRDYS